MPIDRKALRQKMKAGAEAEKKAVKSIHYPLPNLKGPGGNAFALLAEAENLMGSAGVSDATKTKFLVEAKSGDYQHLLNTIREWFTIVVPVTEYVPLEEDADLAKIRDENEYEWEDDEEESQSDPEVDQALAEHEVQTEQDWKDAQLARELDARLREELGLGPDDMVIVQIKRKTDK